MRKCDLKGGTMERFYIKIAAILTCVCFVFSITPDLFGAQFFFQPRKEENRLSGEVGIRIPFGQGTETQKKNVLEELKDEETSGAGTVIALIVLGACIVAAAVIIANKADDVTEEITVKADDLEDKYGDLI